MNSGPRRRNTANGNSTLIYLIGIMGLLGVLVHYSGFQHLISPPNGIAEDGPTYRLNGTEPDSAVIFFHDVGLTGDDWRNLAQAAHDKYPHVNFIMPTAATRYVHTAGKHLPGWYGEVWRILGPDPATMFASISTAISLVRDENEAGIPLNRIFLVGKGQGAVVALGAFINSRHKLGGLIAINGQFPNHLQPTRANSHSPVLLIDDAKTAAKTTQKLGMWGYKNVETVSMSNTDTHFLEFLSHNL